LTQLNLVKNPIATKMKRMMEMTMSCMRSSIKRAAGEKIDTATQTTADTGAAAACVQQAAAAYHKVASNGLVQLLAHRCACDPCERHVLLVGQLGLHQVSEGVLPALSRQAAMWLG
jgi:hypothetical protein